LSESKIFNNLTELNLSSNNIGEEGILYIKDFNFISKLKSLNLYNNKIDKKIEKQYEEFYNFITYDYF